MSRIISSSTIEEVNSRTDIVALVNEYTHLEKRSGDYWGCCPFHNEKSPSFHVVPSRKMYHCFGCGAGGGVIKFYMEVERMGFTDAVEALAKKAGIEVVYDSGSSGKDDSFKEQNLRDQYKELYTRVAGSYHYVLQNLESAAFVRDYLEKRGVSKQIQEQFMLGFSPNDAFWLRKFLKDKNYSDEFLDNSGLFSKKNPRCSFFWNRLMFPICDRNGKVVAFGGRIMQGEGPKYVNSGELIQYHKGETLYAFHLAKQTIRQKKAAILCEGYMDVIAWHQAGMTNAVAPLGTALTEEQLNILRPFADTLFLSFDSDEAGQKATVRAIKLARQKDFTVKVIRLEGGKDPSEILNSFGVEALTNAISGAILDDDFLLSVYAKQFDVTNPEGKTRASLAFFEYIDVLSTDIQKQSCLEKLCRTYQIKSEAITADYYNRDGAKRRIDNATRQPSGPSERPVRMDAEMRSVLAFAANLDFFQTVRNSVSVEDFENEDAESLFITLEECFREETFSYDTILSKCTSENLRQKLAEAVTSGEYSVKPEKTVEDAVAFFQKSRLVRRRRRILNRIEQLSQQPGSLQTQQEIISLQNELMSIDIK